MSKKDYSPKEAAKLLLDKLGTKAKEKLKEREADSDKMLLKKTSPENKSTAQVSDFKISQPSPPKGNEKTIPQQKELKLKKFMDKISSKRMEKSEKSKHDRCVEEVKEKTPNAKNPHAICISAGVKPEKWSK